MNYYLGLALLLQPHLHQGHAGLHVQEWKETILSELSQHNKLCLGKSEKVCPGFSLKIQGIEKPIEEELFSGHSFLVYEEDKEQEEVVLYTRGRGRKAWWTWNRERKEVATFKNNNSEIILIQYDNTTFAFRQLLNTSHYTPCSISQMITVNNILTPTCIPTTTQIISLQVDPTGSPAWYVYARLAMQDPRLAQHHLEKRKQQDQKFLSLPFFRENIMSADELYKHKIEPNLPRGTSLNCSHILDNAPLRAAPRRGLVGFPGSGNSWIRLLIDIATGVDTCADRVELHDDGEEILETEKNKLVDVFRGLFDHTNSSHVDDAQ